MANALALFEPNAVPDHVREFLNENSNIPASDTTPTLSIRGKVFTINLGGEATKVMKRNDEGEEEPVSILPVVILASNERRGRNLYDGAYDPEKAAAPVCWSNDGIKPDATIPSPKASTCAKCPMSVKGSKVSDNGKATVACAEFRNIAVVPAHDLTFEPLRVKLPVTSDYDGKNKEAMAKGWYGFKNYIDLLRSKGYKDTRALSTKLRFDPSSEWPKLQFSPGKWLTPEALAQAKALSETDGVKELLVTKFTPRVEDTEDAEKTLPQSDDDDDDAPITLVKPKPNPTKPTTQAAIAEPDDDDEAATPSGPTPAQIAKEKAEAALKAKAEEAAKAAKAKANGAAKPAPVVEDDEDEDAIIAQAIARKKAKAEEVAKAAATASKPSKEAAKPPKATTTKAPVADDDEPPVAASKAPKTAAAAPAKPVQVSAAVASVLGAWGDDDD